MSDVLSGVMKRLGLEQEHWAAGLEASWPAIAGPAVAPHSRPGPLRGKTLTVYIDSPVWLNELQRVGRGPLLSRLQEHAGKRIAAISLELDPDG